MCGNIVHEDWFSASSAVRVVALWVHRRAVLSHLNLVYEAVPRGYAVERRLPLRGSKDDLFIMELACRELIMELAAVGPVTHYKVNTSFCHSEA